MSSDVNYASKRVLVTGATGFIGSRLRSHLVSTGAEVHATSRRPHDSDSDTATWWTVDLSDADACTHVVNEVRPDITFHLASHVSGSRDLDAVRPTFEGNLKSAVGLLTALAAVGTDKVVLAGSLEEPEPGDAPVSPYAAAKSGATLYARMFAELYSLPVAVARIFMVYGPDQPDETKLVPYLYDCFSRAEPPRMSSGVREVDWIYVDDVVGGLMALATGDGARSGESVDIGSGDLVSIRGFVESFARACSYDGVLGFGELPDRPTERIRVADVEATGNAIGWQPGTSLEDGLIQTAAWFEERSRTTDGTVTG